MAWAQDVLGIGKAKLPGQSARRWIHRALDGVETSLVRKDGAVRKNKLDAEFFLEGLIAIGAAPGESEVFRLGNRAPKEDRVKLRYSVKHSLTPSNQASDFFLRRANDPINRRSDIGVAEIELSLRDGRGTLGCQAAGS